MYFESRGNAERATVICSAVSTDLLQWTHESGVRLEGFAGVGGPRYVPLGDGRGRLYCFATEVNSSSDPPRRRQSVVSATTHDGLNFSWDAGVRLPDRQGQQDNAGITAAEVIPPADGDEVWTMIYSAWQDVPAGTVVPLHPSQDPQAVQTGRSDDFAAASIASDMAGFRSRIFRATSADGLTWKPAGCVVAGGGYESDDLDAVHAEDMSIVKIDEQRYRMYYAACDRLGTWRIASAINL